MQKNLYFSEDITEFLYLLYKYSVKYIIVGGEAVLYYGHSRLTGDIDIFYQNTIENVEKLYSALSEFWGNDIPGIKDKSELMEPGIIFQFGVPPNRIDLMNQIENVTFEEAYVNKNEASIFYKNSAISIYYIGIKELIKNKSTMMRPKDQEDLKYLKKFFRDN